MSWRNNTCSRDKNTRRGHWADGMVSGHVMGDRAVISVAELGMTCQRSKRCREGKGNRKEWMALHFEGLLNE